MQKENVLYYKSVTNFVLEFVFLIDSYYEYLDLVCDVYWIFALEIKQLGCGSDHPPPSSSKLSMG